MFVQQSYSSSQEKLHFRNYLMRKVELFFRGSKHTIVANWETQQAGDLNASAPLQNFINSLEIKPFTFIYHITNVSIRIINLF